MSPSRPSCSPRSHSPAARCSAPAPSRARRRSSGCGRGPRAGGRRSRATCCARRTTGSWGRASASDRSICGCCRSRDLAGAAVDKSLAGSEDAFVLAFAGPLDAALEGGTHAVTHPALGTFELFVSAVEQPQSERRYEAVIDRSVGAKRARAASRTRRRARSGSSSAASRWYQQRTGVPLQRPRHRQLHARQHRSRREDPSPQSSKTSRDIKGGSLRSPPTPAAGGRQAAVPRRRPCPRRCPAPRTASATSSAMAPARGSATHGAPAASRGAASALLPDRRTSRHSLRRRLLAPGDAPPACCALIGKRRRSAT